MKRNSSVFSLSLWERGRGEGPFLPLVCLKAYSLKPTACFGCGYAALCGLVKISGYILLPSPAIASLRETSLLA
jgi:hypothetical protein